MHGEFCFFHLKMCFFWKIVRRPAAKLICKWYDFQLRNPIGRQRIIQFFVDQVLDAAAMGFLLRVYRQNRYCPTQFSEAIRSTQSQKFVPPEASTTICPRAVMPITAAPAGPNMRILRMLE